MSQNLTPHKIDQWVDAQMAAAIQEHRELVRIPNDANYPADMTKNTIWLKAAFEKRGLKVSILEAGEVPIFFAEKIVGNNKPTVLFYLHYDGQPVDPSKWSQEHPFQPVLKQENKEGEWEEIDYKNAESRYEKEWRVFGRAAADDKGPIIMMLKAFDILNAQNITPAYNIKILLDGEEEKGSNGLKINTGKIQRDLCSRPFDYYGWPSSSY